MDDILSMTKDQLIEKYNGVTRQLARAADRIEELEAQDAAFVRTAEMLTNLGPADIGMVPLAPIEGCSQLWREADNEYSEDRFIGLVQGGADGE